MPALEKEPPRRFQSTTAFQNALENVRCQLAGTLAKTAGGPSTKPPPISPVLSSQSDREANRGLWMMVGAIACVIVLIAAAVTLPHVWRGSAASKPVRNIAQTSMARPIQAQEPHELEQKSKAPPTEVRGSADTMQPKERHNGIRGSAASISKAPLPHASASVDSMQSKAALTQPAPAASGATPIPAPTPPTGPSPEETEKVHDSLIQLHARADAVRNSLGQLREQQAASGLALRQDIAASASRLDMYLQAADQAIESNNLESAHKNMDHVEEELSKLEAFLGK